MPILAALAAVASFGSNPGALDMYEYVPAGLPSGRPLVVVMHGCTQTASAMEGAGWEALADQFQFAVVYPQQRSANQSLSCFTWYGPTDIARTGGEAESIIQMVDTEIATHASDTHRVYVTGLSAGAAFTAVMLAAYPDRFAAGSIMSGLPYKCATDLTSASSCQQMSASSQKTPQAWGDLVRGADSGFAGRGRACRSGRARATTRSRPRMRPSSSSSGPTCGEPIKPPMRPIRSAPRRARSSCAGTTVAVELYTVTGMGHAIAIGVDPDGACPATTGAYFSDEKICSTTRAAAFFGLTGATGSGSDSGSDGGGGGGGGGDDDGSGGGSSGDGGCNAVGSAGVATSLLLLGLVRRRRG